MNKCLSHGEIWRGSNAEISLILFPKCYDVSKVSNVIVNLYTVTGTSVEFSGEDLHQEDNMAYIVLQIPQLEVFEDGLLKYIVEYDYIEKHYVVENETRYFVKTPDSYIPIHLVTEENTQFYDKLVKNADYLYSVDYSQLDYEFAKDYFLTKVPDLVRGGCTSVRKGNFYGRNLDWLYSNYVDFIVKTKDTIGLSGAISTLTKNYLESNQKGTIYKLVPFYLQDGINVHGVFANVNVVNTEQSKGITTESIPAIEVRDKICSVMLVRYILDNFKSATDAVNYIKNYISIYMPGALYEMGYESHWMIGDKEKTYVLEIVNNEVVFYEHNILSNFYIDGVSFNEDGTLYSIIDTPEHTPTLENGLTTYASGIERYNIAALHNGTMRDLMNSLMYTNTYSKEEGNDFWYSEYVGNGLGIDNTVSEYDANGRIGRIKQQFAERTRENPITWQTTHSCVYNIEDLTLEIVAQEDFNQTFNVVLEKTIGQSDLNTAINAETARTEATYLKEHQDISGKADKSVLDAAISAFTQELSTKQHILTAGQNVHIANNVITADGNVASTTINTIWIGSESEYQQITTKRNDTLYFINED